MNHSLELNPEHTPDPDKQDKPKPAEHPRARTRYHRILCSRGHMTVLPYGISREAIIQFRCQHGITEISPYLDSYTPDNVVNLTRTCNCNGAWSEIVNIADNLPTHLEQAEPRRYVIPQRSVSPKNTRNIGG